MDYSTAYIKRLLRKDIEKTISPHELRFLQEVRPLFDQEEWKEMEIDMILGLPEESTADESAKVDRLLKIAEKKVLAQEQADSQRTNSYLTGESGFNALLYWITGTAAIITVAIIALISGRYDSGRNPVLSYADLRCVDIPLDEELPLNGFPVRVSWGNGEEMLIEAGATGTVSRMGDIELRRNASGELLLARRPLNDQSHIADDDDSTALQIRTAAKEQAEVMLPGGTRIRLNAGSTLTYRPRKNLFEDRSVEICIIGEALVLSPPAPPVPDEDDREQPALHLTTLNAKIQTAGADFSLLSLHGTTMLTLLEGALTARSIPSGQSYEIRERDKRFVLHTPRQGDTVLPDRWGFRYLGKWEEPADWTKRVQHFHDIPMREFIRAMGRWYGFRINRLDCIPAYLRISVVVCRDTPVEDMLAVVREAGVPIHQVDGVYSFCDPPGIVEGILPVVGERSVPIKGGKRLLSRIGPERGRDFRD